MDILLGLKAEASTAEATCALRALSPSTTSAVL